LTRIGVTNFGFGRWDNGESKINNHVNKVSETLEKMQSTQALIDALANEITQTN
ncbi:TPA: hypothetical protein RPN34_004669, partial [Escherichia coli]|nr:hypothetical protein [Escherichia coli]